MNIESYWCIGNLYRQARACQPHPHPLPQMGGGLALTVQIHPGIQNIKYSGTTPPSPLGEGMGVGLTHGCNIYRNRGPILKIYRVITLAICLYICSWNTPALQAQIKTNPAVFKPIAIQMLPTSTGTVKNTGGEPLIGAKVQVVGSEQKGAVTDVDGRYRISWTGTSAQLKFSYTGYKDKTVVVTEAKPAASVVLEAIKISDVIVLGQRATPDNTTSPAPQSPKGPSNNPFYIPAMIQSDLDLAGTHVLNIANTIYRDENIGSGYYYFLPAYYALPWSAASGKYGLQVLYGADGKIRVTAELRPRFREQEIAVARELLQKNIQGKPEQPYGVKALNPMTTAQDMSIEFTNLQQFGIEDKDVAIRPPTDFFDAISITFTTQNIDELMAMFFNNVGLYGDVIVSPAGEGMPERTRIPFYIKIQSPRTLGKLDLGAQTWRRDGWENQTDFPLALSNLNMLKKDNTGYRIYTWSLGDAVVAPGEKILFDAKSIPKGLENDPGVRSVWLDYTPLDCSECNVRVKDTIITGVRPDEQVQPVSITVIVLSPLEFTKANQIRLKIRSVQTTPDGAGASLRELNPVVIKADFTDQPAGNLYMRESTGVSLDYQIQVIMPDGKKYESAWVHHTDRDLILGEQQIRDLIEHFNTN